MSANESTTQRAATTPDALADAAPAVRCGPVELTGTDNALYERHLLFDNVVDPAAADAARAFRGLRALRPRRPLAALGAHRADLRAREPQARLLPLDGVSDRPLAGQQRHESAARSASSSEAVKTEASIGSACSSRSPTRAWATAGSAGWRRASSIRWRRCSFRPWATACATSTAFSGRPSRTAGSTSSPTTGCAAPTRGRSPAPTRRSRSS